MRLLFASSSGSGHFLPLVPWIDAAVARGHEVVVFGPASLGPSVHGVRFVAGADPDPEALGKVWASLDAMTRDEAETTVVREVFTRLNGGALLPGARQLIADFCPDALLREPAEAGSAVAAAEAGTPQLRIALGLAEGEVGYLEMAGDAIEELGPGSREVIAGSPCLTRMPESIDRAPIPVTRYREERPGPAGLSADWGDPGAPLLYVTFGTEAPKMGPMAAVYSYALAALADVPCRVLLTVGRAFDITSLGPVPDHVRVEAWADQRGAMAHAAAVLHHGGSGTTLDALAVGCPQVVFPLFADQPQNAAAIDAAGVGIGLPDNSGEARRRVSPDDVPLLREAVETALAEPSYRTMAESVAAEIQRLPTLDDVAAGVLPGW